ALLSEARMRRVSTFSIASFPAVPCGISSLAKSTSTVWPPDELPLLLLSRCSNATITTPTTTNATPATTSRFDRRTVPPSARLRTLGPHRHHPRGRPAPSLLMPHCPSHSGL